MLFEVGADLGLLASQRQRIQDALAGGECELGPVELPSYPTTAGEGPVRHRDGLVLFVVDRVFGEVRLHEVDHLAVLEGVRRSRCDLDDVGLVLAGLLADVRPASGCGEDRRHHEVDGDDVDHTLGHPGELFEKASGVGGDDRFGHTEAANPARYRLGERRFDDGGPHNGDRHPVSGLDEAAFAECLGEGVGIGETEACRPNPTRLGHLFADPLLPEALDPLGDGGGSGCAEGLDGVGLECLQALRGSAGLLGVLSGLEGIVGFGSPVDVNEERGVLHHLLWGVTAARSGDIAGGHGDEVGLFARRKATRGGFGSGFGGDAECSGHPAGAEEVDLHGIVERRVEAHRGGGVHGDVDGAEECEPGVVKAEAVLTDVAFHCEHSTVAHLVEGLAVQTASCDGVLLERITESVEGVVLENVALHPVLGAAASWPHQQHEFAIGNRAQEAFDERSAEKAGRAGDGDPLAGQVLPDHATYLMITVLPLLSPNW